MIQITKQDINQLDIGHWADLSLSTLEEHARSENLGRFGGWLLPQLVAHFGTWRLHTTIKETVLANTENPYNRTLYHLAMITRSALVPKQILEPEYAQLTPLILCGFKRYKGIDYEHWRDQENLNWILEPKLYEAVVNQPKLDLEESRLLELQNQALTIKTSRIVDKIGTQHKASSHYRLSGLMGTELERLPLLYQHMLLQTWLAHPQHRKSTMILNPHNWDSMPKPLVEWQPIVEPQSNKHKRNQKVQGPTHTLPWLA